MQLGSGSAVDILAHEAAQTEMDARNALYNSALNVRSLRIQSRNQASNATNTLLTGGAAVAAGHLKRKAETPKITGTRKGYGEQNPYASASKGGRPRYRG